MADPQAPSRAVVTTIAAKCRRCYNCVRSCPANAIRVQEGQACVIEDRCIGCGNCIRVCAQNAKQVEPALPLVSDMLADAAPAVAILAPSYPAAFEDLSPGQVVAAVRRLGFDRVMEVAFGAEMVASAYARLLKRPPPHPVISTPCPALVSYIEKYMPDLVPNLAPIVSPMIATARAVKQKYLPDANIVFIGPCIAKKAELRDPPVAGVVEAAMTYQELEALLAEREVEVGSLEPEPADGPLPYYGALFPVSGGLLKAAAIQADLMDDSIVVVEGADHCLAAFAALRDGKFTARFLDALLCEGCIAGPAFGNDLPPLARKSRVTAHVRSLQDQAPRLRRSLRDVAQIDVSRAFAAQNIALAMPNETEIREILARTNKHTPDQELNCGACGYRTCREKAIAVYQGLAEPEMCLPYLIEQLEVNLERLSGSKAEIERARERAMRAQQLASMGRLSADIAQEISKPLGHIVVYAQLLRDELPPDDPRREDLATIIAEGLHCRDVMSSLRGFARQHEPEWEEVHPNAVVARALDELAPRLVTSSLELRQDLASDLPMIVADPAQLAQVIVNVVTNSIEAIQGRGEISIQTRLADERHKLEIVVRDNGCGLDPAILDRVFQPFVTTKGPRRGAGLGLAVAHGIVQTHGGEIEIQSQRGEGTTVTIRIPLRPKAVSPREAIKVLVVDDDPDFLEQHKVMLQASGFEVVTAERSDEAIETANREIPDAFVLDLMMERTDSGARLARALRRDPRFRRAPIILLTSVVQDMGFEFSRNPQEVLDWMKADAWFDKPAPTAELAATLRRLLAEREEEGAAQTEAGEES